MTQPEQPEPELHPQSNDRPVEDESPAERIGYGRRTEPVDLEIPPSARTLGNLRDRKRRIE
jgi:hypothetical protein